MGREHLRDALYFELDQWELDATPRERGTCGLEHQDLHHVNGGQAATHDKGAIACLVALSGVVHLVRVVKPDDECILVDEAAAHEALRPFDRKPPIPPGAAGQNDGAEAPA